MTTVIKTKNSTTTTTAPSSLAQGELAVNITDKKLWVGNAAGTPVQIAGTGAATAGGSNTQVQYNSSGAFAGSSNMTFDGTALTLGGNPTLSAGTANGVLYLNGSKVATSGTGLVFDGTNLGIGTSSPNALLDVFGSGKSVLVGGTSSANIPTQISASNLYLSTGWDASNKRNVSISVDGNNNMLFGGSGSIAYANLPSTASYTTRMTLDSSGNLGLGVTPSAWGTTSKAFELSAGSIESRSSTLSFGTNAYYNAGWKYVGSAAAALYAQSSGIHYWYNAPSGTAGNTANFTQTMTLDANGNLLVGTTTGSFASGGGINVKNASSGVVRIIGGANTGFDLQQDSGANTYVWNRDSGYMAFATANTERMRIDSSGNLLIGKTSTSNTAIGTAICTDAVAGINTVRSASTNGSTTWEVYSTGASAYRFYVGMGGTIYATSTSISAISDQSLKENVKDLETGLAEVMALKPRRFDWKNGDATNVAGFIAQEVEEVLPELVTDYKYSQDEDGNQITKKSLKMGDMLPTLVKAIQELKAEVDALKAAK